MSESSVRPTDASSSSPPSTARRYPRPRLSSLGLGPGKLTRLKRLLYQHGPGGGTLLVLPIDQGLEHGPVDFFSNPDALDPQYQ